MERRGRPRLNRGNAPATEDGPILFEEEEVAREDLEPEPEEQDPEEDEQEIGQCVTVGGVEWEFGVGRTMDPANYSRCATFSPNLPLLCIWG